MNEEVKLKNSVLDTVLYQKGLEVHPEYPRKQFRRERWQSLNGAWQFTFDETARSLPAEIQNWDRTIEVPFAPEADASGIGDRGFHPVCWYKKNFKAEKQSDRRVLLHFGAVDYRARVWVNHLFVGSHEGGYTPFTFDITDSLTDEGDNIVHVCAEDDPHDLTKPRGKQDWQLNPHSIWYPRTSGIWQSVWLEEVPNTYIDRVIFTPVLNQWEIGLEAFLAGEPGEGLQLNVKMSVGRQVLVDDRYGVVSGEVHRRIAFSDPGIDDSRNEILWSPEKPTLIQVELELVQHGKTLDRVYSYTALRGVDIQRERFLLNARPYYLRMVLDQGYWPETLMTPPSQDAIKKDIQLTKAAGFNGVRKHQKIESPDYLYWADVMGLLVWEEMPSAYRFTHESVGRLMKEWIEVIDRDINHPCIITWVPFNESWGVPDLPEKATHRACVQALYYTTKTLDPSRPVVGNDGWESSATDILGIHDYDSNPTRILKRYGDRVGFRDVLSRDRPGGRMLTLDGHSHDGHPVVLTEFGGIACVDPRYHEGLPTWGYSVGLTAHDLQQKYLHLMETIHSIQLFSGFCYTQLIDTFQEANGLFFEDRTPKFPIELIRSATLGDGSHRTAEMVAPPALYPPTQA